MHTHAIKINEIVRSSKLSPAEQEEFLSLLSQSTDEELVAVVNVCKDDQRWIGKLYENYKEKKQAIEKKDTNAWREIVQNEHDALREIESRDY